MTKITTPWNGSLSIALKNVLTVLLILGIFIAVVLFLTSYAGIDDVTELDKRVSNDIIKLDKRVSSVELSDEFRDKAMSDIEKDLENLNTKIDEILIFFKIREKEKK